MTNHKQNENVFDKCADMLEKALASGDDDAIKEAFLKGSSMIREEYDKNNLKRHKMHNYFEDIIKL